MERRHRRDRGGAVLRLADHLEPLAFKEGPRRLAKAGVVVDDENRGHRGNGGTLRVFVRYGCPHSFTVRYPSGVLELRPVQTDADRETYVSIRNAIHPETPMTIEAHFAETRQDDRADLLAYLDGTPVGTATGRRHFENRDSPLAFVSVRVLEQARRRGVGSALFRAISEHARSIGRSGLYTIVRLDDADSNEYLGKRGFEEVLRVEEVSLPLKDAKAAVAPPEGVELVAFGPELDARVHPLALQIEQEIPTGEPVAPLGLEDWRRRMLGPGVLRELSFVALAGDTVVGFAIAGAESEPDIAEHWLTGVRRDWRRRGLASALRAAQIEVARRAGLRELRTQQESMNEPIRRVNERLGYRPRLIWLDLAGPLLL
jgi:mycothiol synthase